MLKNRVQHAYKLIQDPNNLPGVQNPVEKHCLVVVNGNGTLMFNTAGQLTNLNNPQNDAMHGLTFLHWNKNSGILLHSLQNCTVLSIKCKQVDREAKLLGSRWLN